MEATVERALEVRDVVKSYAGTTVLRGVSIAIRPGEVVGLVGHNGAGKSTLMKVIAGAIRPDSGRVETDTVPIPSGSPSDSIAAGVATVYQELSLLPNLTVTQNVFLGSEQRRAGMLRGGAMRAEAQQLVARFGLDIDVDRKVGDYPVATRQLLEVAIATFRNARYLLLDEPTTSLEGQQVDRFLDTVRELAAQGMGIVLVDHKLDELYAVASRIIALVDGEVRIDADLNTVSRDDVVHAIAGEDAGSEAAIASEAGDPTDAEVSLRGSGLTNSALRDVTFEARSGRVLGIYGLVGAGRTELLRSLVGLEPVGRGVITLFGRRFRPRDPGAAMRAGVVYVTEDRKLDGIVPLLDSSVNTMLATLREAYSFGALDHRKLRRSADELMDRLRVKGNRNAPVESLSGGNQQKVILARALAQRPRVLLLDEPTKGVDLGVKAEIHRMIRSLAHDDGLTVVVVSSEEDEICEVADDVIVMSHGETSGELLDRDTLTAASLRRAAWAAA